MTLIPLLATNGDFLSYYTCLGLVLFWYVTGLGLVSFQYYTSSVWSSGVLKFRSGYVLGRIHIEYYTGFGSSAKSGVPRKCI